VTRFKHPHTHRGSQMRVPSNGLSQFSLFSLALPLPWRRSMSSAMSMGRRLNVCTAAAHWQNGSHLTLTILIGETNQPDPPMPIETRSRKHLPRVSSPSASDSSSISPDWESSRHQGNDGFSVAALRIRSNSDVSAHSLDSRR